MGVGILACEAACGEIDTFLLSCRVIGRGVETAFLSFLCEQVRKSGCRVVRGRFLPTRKNAPAREFFSSHGFQKISGDEDGSVWELDLAGGNGSSAAWIRVVTLAETNA